eukprot:Pgem_evm1s10682
MSNSFCMEGWLKKKSKLGNSNTYYGLDKDNKVLVAFDDVSKSKPLYYLDLDVYDCAME